MSEYPALTMGAACILGGTMGYAMKGSKPSLISGVGIGGVFLWSVSTIRKYKAGVIENPRTGLKRAFIASYLLFMTSLLRIKKRLGPGHAVMTGTAALLSIYYGRALYV